MLDRLRDFIGRGGPAPGRTTYLGLRSMMFTLDPASLTFEPGTHVHGAWAAAIDFAVGKETATLVAIADGTVSLYTSTGGGVIGGGEHAAVRAEAGRFLEAAAGAVPVMNVVHDIPSTPSPGHVRLSVRTFDETVSDEVAEDVIQRGRHVLSPLYAAGQDLLTEVRLTTERVEAERGSAT